VFFFGQGIWPSTEAEGEGPHIVMAIIRQFVERGTLGSVEAEVSYGVDRG